MTELAGHASFLYRLTRAVYEPSGWQEAAARAAHEIHSLAPDAALLIFLLDPEGKELQCAFPTQGGPIEGRTTSLDLDGDLLVQTLADGQPRTFSGAPLTQASLRHLKWDGEHPPRSIVIVPLRRRDRSVGALELVRLAGGDPDLPASRLPGPGGDLADPALLGEIGALLGSALAARREQERRDLGRLEAVSRLTQLYDIGRTFNSTLEIEGLLPLVANRVANILGVEQCNVWLFEEQGSLRCAAAWGPAAGAVEGTYLGAGEGVAGQVAATGRDMVVADASASERTRRRREREAGMEVRSVAAVLLEAKERRLGVLEVLNRSDGSRFSRADLPFLGDLASQAAIALHNARLLKAERRVGQLHALLEIGREATSTLDLNRVLAAVVNRGSTLLPYDRAAIGLRERARVRVAAVSGMMEVDPRAEEVVVLSEAVRWAAERGEGIYLSELEGKIATDVPGAAEWFSGYSAKTGAKSFVSLPLSDDEGNLGVLTMESSAPYFLSEAQLELAQILALQATAAIRNARLYQQVPLISVMEPLVKKKEAWLRLPPRKRLAVVGAALGLLAALVLLPWRLRVGGPATVMPLRTIAVSAEVQGTVESVQRREGDRVEAGEVIAILQDLDTRMALAKARADLDIARREKSRLEAGLQFASAQMEGVRLAQLEQEVALLERKAELARLQAPAAGIILTPRIEQKVGAMLHRGDAFCHLADAAGPTVEIQVPEQEVGGIRPEAPVWVKVAAFPSETFRGQVFLVASQAVETEEGRSFTVRARLSDADHLRPGMTGRAKVAAGTRSFGYVLLRRPARWMWRNLWPWLP